MKHNNEPELFREICENKALRLEVVKKSFFWFYHLYFYKYLMYGTADFQKEIIYHLQETKKKNILLTGFPKCGKSLIGTFVFPLWKILTGQAQSVVIVFRTKE